MLLQIIAYADNDIQRTNFVSYIVNNTANYKDSKKFHSYGNSNTDATLRLDNGIKILNTHQKTRIHQDVPSCL